MKRSALLVSFLPLSLVLFACALQPPPEEPPPAEPAEEQSTEIQAPKERTTEDAGGDGGVSKVQPAPESRVIRMTSESWKFTPNVVAVKKGENVTIQISGLSGTHGFSVPGLGINAPVITGQTVTVKVPTDKAGTFPFLCSIPCGAGHTDMRGQIVIQE